MRTATSMVRAARAPPACARAAPAQGAAPPPTTPAASLAPAASDAAPARHRRPQPRRRRRSPRTGRDWQPGGQPHRPQRRQGRVRGSAGAPAAPHTGVSFAAAMNREKRAPTRTAPPGGKITAPFFNTMVQRVVIDPSRSAEGAKGASLVCTTRLKGCAVAHLSSRWSASWVC